MESHTHSEAALGVFRFLWRVHTMLAVRSACQASAPAASRAFAQSVASSGCMRHYSRKFGQRDRPRPFHKEKRRVKSEFPHGSPGIHGVEVPATPSQPVVAHWCLLLRDANSSVASQQLSYGMSLCHCSDLRPKPWTLPPQKQGIHGQQRSSPHQAIPQVGTQGD